MTDIEKLAAALKWRHPDMIFSIDTFEDVRKYAGYLGLTDNEIVGLAGGTHVVVPVEPTAQQIGSARPILLAFNMEFTDKFRLREHLEEYGIGLPSWAQSHVGSMTITKGACADMIYKAMLKAAQEGV